MKRLNKGLSLVAGPCPNCDSNRVETSIEEDVFTYGNGPKAVELRAAIPFRTCKDCQFEYTDAVAEDLRHEAVCRHLGVMTPKEIINLRKRQGLTRAEFAQRSRIGEASLARWETGEFIQTQANDNYLFLLGFPENMDRIMKRVSRSEVEPEVKERRRGVFRALFGSKVEETRVEALAFEL